MRITLYSIGCPQCMVLKKKLEAKHIIFEEENNIDTLIDHGYMSMPILRIDDEFLEFEDAIAWVKNYKED